MAVATSKSILTTIKLALGIVEVDTNFDEDIVTNINTALFRLNQLGIGPTTGFTISDKTTTWEDFIGVRKDLEAIKTYIYLKVRLAFDPPQNSFLVDSIKEQIKEYEWTLNVQAESKGE